jgi:hypothetical protein
MREGGTDAAAVDVDDVFALTQREDDALIESIRAVHVEQAGLPQQIEGITLCREMTAQTPARSVTDLEFSDQGGIVHSAPVEIAHRFGIVIELLLIESDSLFQRCGRIHYRIGLRIKAGEALAERQSAGQLDKANQVSTLSAAMAIENILARVDIEGLGRLVQRTETDVSERPIGEPFQLCVRKYSISGSRRLSVSTSSPTALFCLRSQA